MKDKIYENNVKNGRSDGDKDELVRITSLSSDTITKGKEKYLHSLQSRPKLMAKTAKNGVVLDTTSNVQPI